MTLPNVLDDESFYPVTSPYPKRRARPQRYTRHRNRKVCGFLYMSAVNTVNTY